MSTNHQKFAVGIALDSYGGCNRGLVPPVHPPRFTIVSTVEDWSQAMQAALEDCLDEIRNWHDATARATAGGTGCRIAVEAVSWTMRLSAVVTVLVPEKGEGRVTHGQE